MIPFSFYYFFSHFLSICSQLKSRLNEAKANSVQIHVQIQYIYFASSSAFTTYCYCPFLKEKTKQKILLFPFTIQWHCFSFVMALTEARLNKNKTTTNFFSHFQINACHKISTYMKLKLT